MPLQRRLQLLDWAEKNNAYIIEDDYDGELRYDGHPVAALKSLDQQGRVIYLGSFSKVLFPALRVGYVILPPALLRPFLQTKQLMDRGAPTLTQAPLPTSLLVATSNGTSASCAKHTAHDMPHYATHWTKT